MSGHELSSLHILSVNSQPQAGGSTVHFSDEEKDSEK